MTQSPGSPLFNLSWKTSIPGTLSLWCQAGGGRCPPFVRGRAQCAAPAREEPIPSDCGEAHAGRQARRRQECPAPERDDAGRPQAVLQCPLGPRSILQYHSVRARAFRLRSRTIPPWCPPLFVVLEEDWLCLRAGVIYTGVQGGSNGGRVRLRRRFPVLTYPCYH